VALKPTRWATVDEIRAGRELWPYSVPAAIHVAGIRHETGLSEQAARLALDLARGDSEGDEIMVDERL
jgi:hypothetical protein